MKEPYDFQPLFQIVLWFLAMIGLMGILHIGIRIVPLPDDGSTPTAWYE